MSLTTGIVLTVLLLLGNGFFVAAEFALVAAKRPRLEKDAEAGSRPAAAAVAGIRELSLTLAGAQLGITMCSLGLGVVSEPVFASVLTPWFHHAGLSTAAAHAVSFAIALTLVTFLHMVIGEMAPKSWAIARPERSATLLAMPFRGFIWVFRPMLSALNGVTNALLRLGGIEPRDAMSVSRTPEQLQHLVEESRRLGLIDEADHTVLTRALDAPSTGLDGMVVPLADAASVPAGALPQEVIDVATRTGRTRLLVRAANGEATGFIHARSAYLARADGRATPARALSHPIPVLASDTPVATAVGAMRARHSQLALVRTPQGPVIGLISLDDLLTNLLT